MQSSHPPSSKPWRVAHAVHRHEPAHLLVGEDDDDIRLLVAEALRRDGYEVHEAADGARLLFEINAQDALSHPQVDLVITDIRMPICTGLEIVQALRNVNWTVPVIFMTAYSDAITRTDAEAVGAVLFHKPFSMDDLRTAVMNLLPKAA